MLSVALKELGPDGTSSLHHRPSFGCLCKAGVRTQGSQASDASTRYFHQMAPFFRFCSWVSMATLPSATGSFFLHWFWDTGSRQRTQRAPFRVRKSLRKQMGCPDFSTVQQRHVLGHEISLHHMAHCSRSIARGFVSLTNLPLKHSSTKCPLGS